MSSLTSLPYELQAYILRVVYLSSRKEPDYMSVVFQDADGIERSVRTAIDLKPEDMDWEPSTDSKSKLFPFNIACVCQLWREILMRSSEYWTRIIFDVAIDPIPLLDAFSWSKTLPIDVHIFNSSPVYKSATQSQDAQRENDLVTLITEHLLPHVHRCTSITFDVKYASSLPPLAIVFTQNVPLLETFGLDCAINDLDSTPRVPSHDTSMKDTFPTLRNLSLTGAAFMSLPPEWISTLECGETVALSISHFEFQHDYVDYDGDPSLWNTFEAFMDLIINITFLKDLHLKALTLASVSLQSNRLASRALYALATIGSIHFDGVSPSFIQHFMETVDFTAMSTTTRISNCIIPELDPKHPDRCWSLDGKLILDNIQCPRIMQCPASSCENCSLRNILSIWHGQKLTISSCAGMNDQFLHWLHEGWSGRVEAFDLVIEDCPNFTVKGMLDYLLDSLKCCGDDMSRHIKCFLQVKGNAPILLEQDIQQLRKITQRSFREIRWHDMRLIA